MKRIDDALIGELAARAAGSERRRANHNLHTELSDPVQRFLNAIEPESFVPVHRHTDPERWELFIALSGRVAVLTFDDDGRVLAREELAAAGPLRGIEIPVGAWHTVVALESGTVLFELKEGPYARVSDKDFAPWSPREGDERAAALLEWYRTARPGDQAP